MTDRYLLEDGTGSLFLEDGVSYYLNEAATGLTSVTSTRATTWTALGSVSATRATTWIALSSALATRATTWNTAASVLATRATTWTTRAAILATRATSWSALGSVSATRPTTWTVLASALATRATSWSVAASVATTRATSWAALSAVLATRATGWNTRAAVTATRATTWTVAASTLSTRATTWTTLAAVSGTRATTWGTLTSASATRATTWNVAANLVSITSTRATSWTVIGRATATRATTWTVTAAVSATRATTWTTRAGVTTTRSTSWSALGSTASTRATTWATKVQAASARATSWTTRAPVATSRATSWAVASSLVAQASLEHTVTVESIRHAIAVEAISRALAVEVIDHTVVADAQNHGQTGVSSAVTYAAEKLGAGGWVTGLAISPDGNTRIVRCDTLGGWRWDAAADKWVATTSASSLSAPFNALDAAEGVYAIAAANNRAYMATADAIFTSTDHGATWATSLASGPKTSANVSGVKRYSNHMAIDPNDSLTCLYGTVNQGVFYTRNGGTSWTQVPSASVPIGVDGAATPGASTFGVLCVLIDGSGNWYASPYGSGLYQSTNHGTSWSKISSDTDFVAALGIDLAPNGDIMVCGTTSATTGGIAAANIKVMRYRSGAWSNITPTGTARAWKAPAFDPTSPGRVMVQADGGYTQLSTDYGTTWANQARSFASNDPDVAWLAASNNGDGTQSFFTTIGGLQWDPVVSGRVWMSQGIGVWYATPASNTIQWQAQSRGIEQIVVNDVTVPPGGRPVVSSWDRPIIIVGETNPGGVYPKQYHPDNGTLSSGWHADYSADNPSWVAASVWDRSGFAAEHPGYSTDGGLTWTNFATIPTSGTAYFAGSIHVGQPGHIIWVSAGSKGASYTTDSGTTWTAVAIPGVTMSNLNTQSYFYYRRPIASEKTTGSADTFYAFVTSKGLYKSTDVGANWTQQADNTQFAGNDWSQMTYLKTVPGKPGHLFITPGWQGAGGGAEALGLPFKRSTDGGVTWSTVSTISSVRGYDFGKAAPGANYPTIYAIGYVGGVKGVYRSVDNCASWALLSTQPNGTVDFIRNVGASKDTYGKHWITTAGSGLIVGTPGPTPTAATLDPALSVAAVNHTVEA